MTANLTNIIFLFKTTVARLNRKGLRRLLLVACCWLLVGGTFTIGQTNYYSKSTGNLDALATWGLSTDGTGTAPANFTAANQIFNVRNNATPIIGGNWTVSGAGSKVIVGDGTDAITFTVPPVLVFNSTCDISNNGTLRITSTAGTPYSGILTVNNGGTYEHARNGGTIPAATWNAGSNCNITGITNSTTLSGLTQSFSTFTWDCGSQTSQVSLSQLAAGGLVSGDFNVVTTSTGSIRIVNGTNRTLTILGNLNISGGNFYLLIGTGANRIATINLSGNLNITGGTLSESNNQATSYGQIIFNGTSEQSFYKTGGTISNTINFTVNSNAILNFGTNVLDGSSGTFILSNTGALKIGSTGGISSSGATGNVQVTGTRTFNTGANYTYIGTSGQITGSGLPATVNNLTINNSNDVSLTNGVSINGVLNLTAGKLNIGAINLIISNTGSISGESFSKYIIAEGTGTLTREVGASNILFPVGTSGSYLPLILNNSGTLDNYNVRVFADVLTNGTSGIYYFRD